MRLFRPDGEDEMSFSLGLSPITEFSLNKGVSTSCASVSSSVEWFSDVMICWFVHLTSPHCTLTVCRALVWTLVSGMQKELQICPCGEEGIK